MSLRPIHDPNDAAAALIDMIRAARRVVVLTGAGVSTQSGIPDFRSPGGVWSRMQPIEFSDFCSSEDARLEDWRRRVEMADLFAAAEPNAAHRALAHLSRSGPVTMLVTQNIDGLHARAGTPPEKLIEIHGTGTFAKCLSCSQTMTIEAAQETIERTGASPRCPACGGLVKAAIISFGEEMPQEETFAAQHAAAQADLFIAAGTSLVVYPAAALSLLALEAGAQLAILSRAPTEQDPLAHLVVRAPLAETFEPLEHFQLA